MYYQIPLTWDVGRKGGTRYAVRYLDGVPLYGAAMRCGHGQTGQRLRQRHPAGASGSDHAGDQYHRLMCFWSGVMELLQASGLAERLSRLMAPVLRPLFGSASQDKQAMEAVSANVTANLLGLSNAATPLGLRASERLYVLAGRSGAPDTVLTLIVLNATSIQLIPSTVRRFVRLAEHTRHLILCCRCGELLRLPLRRCCSAASCCVLFFPDGE